MRRLQLPILTRISLTPASFARGVRYNVLKPAQEGAKQANAAQRHLLGDPHSDLSDGFSSSQLKSLTIPSEHEFAVAVSRK